MGQGAYQLTVEHESLGGGKTVAVQSILYQNNIVALRRSLDALCCAVRLAKKSGRCKKVEVFYGDCSPDPCLSCEDVAIFTRDYQDSFSFHYIFFNKNLGSAAGHNRLFEENPCDMILIQNPDIVMAPDVLELFIEKVEHPGVGMVEAKQLPIEHPKDYNRNTGVTGWATTACALVSREIFRKIGGFDEDNFFLYCDDVDFSWRVRLHGLKIVFLGNAVVFHDKSLSKDGKWQPSAAERYYSAEAALFLSWKWCFDKRLKKLLGAFSKSQDENLRKAVQAFETRRKQGKLPKQIDRMHRVGYMRGGFYTKHRFTIP